MVVWAGALGLVVLIRRPPISTRTATLFPSPTLVRLDVRRGTPRGILFSLYLPVAGRGGQLRRQGQRRAQAPGRGGVQGEPAAIQGRELADDRERSEEHTSELQSLMRISYAVF